MATWNEIDGVPENFQPIDTAPIQPGAKVSGPIPPPTVASMPPMAVGTLPPSFQLQPDLTKNIYGGSIPTIRTIPVAPSGVAGINSAIKSTIIQEVSGGTTVEYNGIPAVNNFVSIDQGSGIDITVNATGTATISNSSTVGLDPAVLTMVDDFVGVQNTTQQPTSFQGPWGTLGWNFSAAPGSVVTNLRSSAAGGLGTGLGWSVTWDNNGTAGAVGSLYLCEANTVSQIGYMPAAMPLLENPGWTATFVFKLDAPINPSSPLVTTYSTAKKSMYVGLAGITLPATAQNNNASITPNFQGRPLTFIGVRFDTSTSPGSIALSSVLLSAGGNAIYGFTTTNNNGVNGGLVGQTFVVAGFTGSNNNGTYTCVASTGSGVVLNNPSATAETHAATATSSASLNDSFFTFEAVMNPCFTGGSGVTRNNQQGQTSVTTVAPIQGVWHRLDITCSSAGVVTLTLNGTVTATFIIPQIQVLMQYTGSTGTTNYEVNSNAVSISCIAQGGNQLTTSNPIPNDKATVFPFSAGSQVIIAGMPTALNGTFSLQDTITAGVTAYYNAPGSGSIVNTAMPAGATMTGYPALVPLAAFGNDDTASPTADTARFYFDYFGLDVNIGSGGAGTPTKARYF